MDLETKALIRLEILKLMSTYTEDAEDLELLTKAFEYYVFGGKEKLFDDSRVHNK